MQAVGTLKSHGGWWCVRVGKPRLSSRNVLTGVKDQFYSVEREELRLMMSKRKRGYLLLIALALAMTSSSAQAGQRVSTSCRKRLSDGDIIASDTRKLPELDSGFKVLRYKANRTSDGWSYGPCVLETRP
jgi:hypothetical protein